MITEKAFERAMRESLSAAKARGHFETLGRGLLITAPDKNNEFAQWLRTLNATGRCWRNVYVCLADLKVTGCPADVVQMVDAYDPDTEAVVVIRWEADSAFEPRVVPLDALLAADDDDLPF